MKRIVPRKFIISIEKAGEMEVKVPGIIGVRSYTLLEYDVGLRGLMYQELPKVEVRSANAPFMAKIAPAPWHKYCRWHSHELIDLDSPRLYCTLPASQGDYCRLHKGSLKDNYERCLRSADSFEPCKLVDKEASRRGMDIEYSLYLTWWRTGGALNIKVGVTRAFRS